MSKKHTKLKGLQLDELSLVDKPANTLSKIAIVKRQEDSMANADKDSIVELCKMMPFGDGESDFRQALMEEMKREHAMEVNEKMFPLMDALRESVMASVQDFSGEERDQKIRSNVESFLSAVQQKLDGEPMEKAMATMKGAHSDDMTDEQKKRMKDLMDKEGMSEKEAMEAVKAGSPGKTSKSNQEESDMTIDDLQKRLGDLENQIEQLTKQAEDNGLNVEKSEDGTVKLSKAAPEEYVEVGGERVAKSQVPQGVLKAIEKQQADIEKMQAEREKESLRKRADAELPHLKGTADERGELLKAVDGIADENTRNSVMETLKAADGFAKAAFTEVGKSVADDENSATAQLESKVAKYQEDHGVSYYTAYAEVTKAGEGKVLLNKSRAEQRGQAN